MSHSSSSLQASSPPDGDKLISFDDAVRILRTLPPDYTNDGIYVYVLHGQPHCVIANFLVAAGLPLPDPAVYASKVRGLGLPDIQVSFNDEAIDSIGKILNYPIAPDAMSLLRRVQEWADGDLSWGGAITAALRGETA